MRPVSKPPARCLRRIRRFDKAADKGRVRADRMRQLGQRNIIFLRQANDRECGALGRRKSAAGFQLLERIQIYRDHG